MNIDCPHCGVHGSVDDSLAGKKLRCPKCSKVFLITEKILPEVEDVGIVHQEILYDDKAQEPEIAEQEVLEVEDDADPEEIEALEEEEIAVEIEEPEELIEDSDEIPTPEETPVEEDSNLEECSVCRQSFTPEFMVEVGSKRYCALCQPDSEEEGGELPDKTENDNDPEADDGDILALMADGEEADVEEEGVLLQACSGCGESLHPDFLEKVGAEHYCALCVPEDVDDSDDTGDDGGIENIETEEEEEPEHALLEDEELLEKELPSSEDENAEVADEDGYLKEPCSVCGEAFHPDFMQEVDGQLYCGVCQPEVIEEVVNDEEADRGTDDTTDTMVAEDEDSFEPAQFTIGELVKEAWQKTRGAKGSIWGGVMAMYLIVFAVSFGGMAASQAFYKGSDPMVLAGTNITLQLVSSWLSMLMTGGVMLIGVRRALEQRVSWKMAFAGFSKALSMTVAIILQSILIVIGFILLVLPGIYLAVGYALTLPLILDKGMGPWEALEASRKAIHKKWWTVFGLYLVMLLISTVAAIPLGLGLIWVIPMYFVLVGVLYVHLFGIDESIEEELDEDPEEYFEDDEEEYEESSDDESEEQDTELKEPFVEPESK